LTSPQQSKEYLNPFVISDLPLKSISYHEPLCNSASVYFGLLYIYFGTESPFWGTAAAAQLLYTY